MYALMVHSEGMEATHMWPYRTTNYEFTTKQELLDSFAMYAMQSCGMEKVSAVEYAKMMASYKPALGWHIRDYGSVPKSKPAIEGEHDERRLR